jgi:hypothetical protein
MSIRYYDGADRRLLAVISEQQAEDFLARGIARAVRAKNGKIVRLYSLPRTRTYTNAAEAVSAMHAAANRTVDRTRNSSGAKAWSYDHRHVYAMTGNFSAGFKRFR